MGRLVEEIRSTTALTTTNPFQVAKTNIVWSWATVFSLAQHHERDLAKAAALQEKT